MTEDERTAAGAGTRRGESRPRSGAVAVGAGILASRLAGFVRDRALGHFFGLGPHQDVFRSALRAPNLLQNLLGEQALSASFIPIYTRLLDAGRREEAGRFAGAIFGLLLALVGLLSLAGFVLARPIVALFAAGFLRDAARVATGELTVDRFPLAVAAVRWMFPMTGLLVLSAWALGVLNSHRRFLVSYLAPVAWNAAIIAAVLWAGWSAADGEGTVAMDRLLLAACAGALVGGGLQFLVQLPAVSREMVGFRLSLGWRAPRVREALRAFAPAVGGRGVLQLSSYLDQLLASFLAPGAVAALQYGQQLYLLPVSLFAVSLAAASLPDLSRGGTGEAWADRLVSNLRRVSFFVVPSTVAYLAFGGVVVGGLFQTGSFGEREVLLASTVLGAYALGLPAAAAARPLQSGFYARGDTRRPAAIAAVRVAVGTALGVPAMILLDRVTVGGDPTSTLRLGAAGLALGSAAGSWLEFGALWRKLRRDEPALRLPWRDVGRSLLVALVAAAAGGAAAASLPTGVSPLLEAASVLGLFGITYVAGSFWAGAPEVAGIRRRLHLPPR